MLISQSHIRDLTSAPKLFDNGAIVDKDYSSMGDLVLPIPRREELFSLVTRVKFSTLAAWRSMLSGRHSGRLSCVNAKDRDIGAWKRSSLLPQAEICSSRRKRALSVFDLLQDLWACI